MLATPTFYSHRIYTPSRPSPLSERSANARPFTFTMASPMQNEKKTFVPQRAFKPNPVVQTRDAATQRRRDLFFQRVQKGRDEKKWDVRGEQIQRLDYLSEHKRWEDAKSREAPQLEDQMIEEEVAEEATSSYAPHNAPETEQEMDEADYILAQEEYELQELIASMEQEKEDAVSQHYGSDDEDYDKIFMECTSTAETQHPQQRHQPAQFDTSFDDVDAMDMS